MTKRIEKTVFISYRRTNFPWAYCIYQDLTHHGYDVFFDYQSIGSGSFEKVILENIKARAHFIVLLSPSALERCNQPRDWLRREIETAIDEKRNLIPIMLEGFDFGSPSVKQALTGKLNSLSDINGMSLISEYVDAGLDKLRNRFLNVTLQDVHLHTLTEDTRKITTSQQASANEAPLIAKEELTAQEWFERGYRFSEVKNYAEAIRCLSESIRLDSTRAFAYGLRGASQADQGNFEDAIPDFDKAIKLESSQAAFFISRAISYRGKGDFDNAVIDLTEAIRLNPRDGTIYYSRGNLHQLKGNLEGAYQDYLAAVKLQPRGIHHSSLMIILRKLGREKEARKQENLARELIVNEDEYNQACFEAICGNTEKAIKLLKISFESSPLNKMWARDDPDLENIRNDPRFKGLIEK